MEKNSTKGDVTVTETALDSELRDIQWFRDCSKTPCREIVFMLTTGNKVYRSVDEGQSWDLVLTIGSIRSIVPFRDHSQGIIIFVGSTRGDSKLWTTTDFGDNYTLRHSLSTIYSIRIHPQHPSWVLVTTRSNGCTTGTTSCYTQLDYSSDLAKTWKTIQTYVNQYSWGDAGSSIHSPAATIYATYWPEKYGNQTKKDYKDLNLYKTTDLFLESNHTLLLRSCLSFLFSDYKVLWAASTTSDGNSLQLYVSNDSGKTIVPAKFPSSPDDIAQNRYTILDTTEGMAFINVEHEDFNWGHLYGSDDVDRTYSISLQYNSRSPTGPVDFARIEGIEGIYLANYVTQSGDGALQTVVSDDKGGEWRRTKLLQGNSNCSDAECRVNLFGQTSGYAPFYTMDSAPGLVLGLGNVGVTLRPDVVNTYFSRDGGFNWQIVANGSHIYEFADHGGLMIMAKNTVTTKNIRYSWNEGTTWSECQFTNADFMVKNIVSGSGTDYATSLSSLIYGSYRVSGNVRYSIMHLDFSGLHERQCTGSNIPGSESSDYELWSPHSASESCLLGRRVMYVRRKPNAECFNGVQFERPTINTNCPCGRDDYVCDYCFEADENLRCKPSESCIDDGWDPVFDTVPKDCNGTYFQTNGYRLAVGDTCIISSIGLDLRPQELPCPELPTTSLTEEEGTVSAIFVAFAIFVILLLFGNLMCLSIYAYRIHLQQQKGQLIINPPEINAQMDEDELEISDEDDNRL